ncbi:hypothetical protein N9L68_07525, partial [bacterium]|nr:hypothetical protein [bacterium]
CHEETTGSVAQTAQRSIILHVPLEQYCKEQFMLGISRPEAVLKFQRIAESQTEDCVFQNNEWHAPVYRGIETSVGRVDESGRKTTRARSGIADANELQSHTKTRDPMVVMLVPACLPACPICGRLEGPQTTQQITHMFTLFCWGEVALRRVFLLWSVCSPPHSFFRGPCVLNFCVFVWSVCDFADGSNTYSKYQKKAHTCSPCLF